MTTRARYLGTVVLLAAAYLGAARLGLSFAFATRQVTAVWPPSGIAVAALVLLGARAWPGVLLGAFAANATNDVPFATAGGIAIGNTLGTVAGAVLLRRAVRFDPALTRIRDVLGLVLVAAAAMAITASSGVAQLVLGGIVEPSAYPAVWWVWWIGDAMGVLLVAPLLLSWAAEPRVAWRGRRAVEAGALFASIAAACHVIFHATRQVEIQYAVFPFFIWSALRFGVRETATAVVLVAGLAVWGTIHDRGPFATGSLDARLALLELFLAVAAVAALSLSVVTSQHRRAEAAVERARAELEERIRERTAELAAVNARFQLIADYAQDMIATADARGAFTSISPASRRILGYEPEELIGTLGIDLVHPDDLTATTRLAASGESRLSLVVRSRRKDGTYTWVESNTCFVRDPDTGRSGQVVTITRDISERKAAEDTARALEASLRASEARAAAMLELRERERWFSTTLRAIGDAVIATDPAGAITFMNPAAERLAELREAEAVGRRPAELLAMVDERTREPLPDPIAGALAGGEVVPLPEGAALAGGAGDRPIDGLASPIVDDAGRRLGAVLVVRDVGERRRLHRQIAMADRLGALGTLASGVAHEINNPLTAVVAGAAILEDSLAKVRHQARAPGALPEEVLARIAGRLDALPAVVAALRDGADRVRRIVADLQAFSRPQDEARGRLELRGVLEFAARMTAAELRPRARLAMELGPTPPVEASEVRLGQVFVNLLVNAAQAIEEGHPERNEVRVSTSVDAAGRVVVAIRDTGSGMTPEVAARVFEPFFTTKPMGRGTGLGLSITHGIVRSLGGEITVESTPGAGSTFRVCLPAARATDAPAPAGAPAPVPAPPAAELAAPRARILVIDDDPLVVEVIRGVLEDLHEVVAFTDSREALGALREPPGFDLVLCDLMMPEVTGMDLHERAAALDPALAERFAFVTGGAFTARAASFFETAPNPRLLKPFTPAGLRAFVRDALAALRT